MNNSFSIGKLFGTPLRLHFSWPIIFIYLVIVLSLPSGPGLFPTFSLQMRVLSAIVTSLLFFVSVVIHEQSHNRAAMKRGMPVSSTTLFVFGGVAQTTEEIRRFRTELWIALTGPLGSLGLAAFLLLFWFVLPSNLYVFLSTPVFFLIIMNLWLVLFNLIPGFPLDGGRILRALIWYRTRDSRKSTCIASWAGRGTGYLLVLVGLTIMFTRRLEHIPALLELFGYYGGLWLALLGWLLERAAAASYHQDEVNHILHTQAQEIK